MILGTKNILKSALIVVGLLLFFGLSPQQSFAQPIVVNENQNIGTPLSPNDPNLLPPNSFQNGGGANANGNFGNVPNADDYSGSANQGEIPPPDVPITTFDFKSELYNTLFWFTIAVFGKLFSWSGIIFDVGLNQYVLGFGYQYYDKNVGVAIEEVWKIVRDLFNLTFIFGLVYIGFKMILNSDDSTARKMLVSLLGAALLVNFSLFIVKFVIDVANVAAGVIAKAFTTTPDAPVSIANGFMNLINFSTILQVNAEQMSQLQNGGAFGYIFGLMIFFMVAAFVFAAGGILMIVRFVVLCAYMVFSPIMFIGWVFPSMAGHSKKYMNGFLGNAFFAPAYIMMLYLSFKVLSSYSEKVGDVNYGALFVEDPNTVGNAGLVIPFFILTMVFLVMSLVVAKNMGAVGASTAISIGNKWRGNVQNGLRNAALAAPRYGARTLVGAGAKQLGKINDSMEGSRTGRNFKRALSIASLGALDERGRRDLIKAGKNAKFGGSYSYADDVKLFEDISATRSTEKTKSENKKKITAGLAALESDSTLSQNEKDKAIREMQSVITGMTLSQLETMKDKDRVAIAGELSAAQTEALMKSDKIGADDKAAIVTKRQEVIRKLVGDNASIITSELTKLSVEQLETMGDEFIHTNAHLFTNGQMEDLKKSKRFSESQKNNFSTTRTSSLENAVKTASGAKDILQVKDTAGKYKNRKASDVAKQSAKVLLSSESLPYITDSVLREIVKENSLSPSEMQALRTNILATTSSDPDAQKARDYFSTTHALKNW